jgi:hypothetical protein
LDYDSGDCGSDSYFLGGISDFFTRRERRREKHKQDILKALSTPATKAEVRYSEPNLYYTRVQWMEHTEFSKEAFSHLEYKKYRSILKHLSEAKRYADGKYNEISVKIEQFKKYIKDKLEPFGYIHTLPMASPMPASETVLYNASYFDTTVILQNIFDNTRNAEFSLNRRLKYDWYIPNQNFPTLQAGDRLAAIGDMDALYDLLHLVISLQYDPKIISLVKEISQLQEKIRTRNESLTDFETERLKLIREIGAGQRRLKGHCDLCP